MNSHKRPDGPSGELPAKKKRKAKGSKTSAACKSVVVASEEVRSDLVEILASHLTDDRLSSYVMKNMKSDEFDLNNLSYDSLRDMAKFLEQKIACYYCMEVSDEKDTFMLCGTKSTHGHYCCGRGAHVECIKKTTPSFEHPEGDWFCSICSICE